MHEQVIIFHVDDVKLEGILAMPDITHGMVIFSHGSGSSRLSPRNQQVAKYLQKAGFTTLLFDLLSEEEDLVYSRRFDIELLTHRLMAITNQIATHPEYKALDIAYFGASTGSASALSAAVQLGSQIKAVVSRGGRPDLVINQLPQLQCPTLLIVGELDFEVIKLNKQALDQMFCAKNMVIVPGASHLFEEPGKLDVVARHAAGWFEKYLLTYSRKAGI